MNSTAEHLVETLLDGEDLDPKDEITDMRERDPHGFGVPTFDHLDAFTRGYLEAAWFTEEERLKEEAEQSGLDPDKHDFDWSASAIARAHDDCTAFQEANKEDLEHGTSEQGGMDFWYTRCGHGAGFWDGDWPDDAGARLTAACKKFGEVYTYVGDDGELYFG